MFAERLKNAMDYRKKTITDISENCNLSKGIISNYLSGRFVAKQKNIYKIATYLAVSPSYLIGVSEEMFLKNDALTLNYDDIKLLDKIKIPLLGEIACGTPIYASEDRESYVEIGTTINADFCLKCKGDSMIGARIHDGDIVFVKKQSIVNNGEIAVVIINNEATLKRVFYEKEKEKLVLQAENPTYAPLVYVGEELNEIRILGKAVAFQSDVK